jgi:nucleoside 2-deoxyribosyltransferase
MPFREDKEDLYHFAIRSPVEEEGLQCERTDKKAFVGDVLTRIKMKIGTASLVVGEISQTNPNVYLEVGYAWAQGRKTVLIAEQGTELPPVVKERECFLYPRLVDAGAFMRQTLRLRNVGVYGRLRVARTPPRPEPSTVFVLLPDTNRAADVYHFGIRQPLRTAGLIPQHIEEESRSSGYLALLTDFIDRSVVVIADLSGADATVYLAVGYAWGRNRPTILLIQEGEEPAYDVRGHKCLRYRTIHHLSEILTAELTDLKEQGIFSQG